MKKYLLIVLLTMVIVFSMMMVGFSQDITLRIFWWGGQDRANRTYEVINLFQEKYPNVKIEFEFVGWEDYWEKLAILASSKELPDVMQHEIAYIPMYANSDLLLPLDPYVEDNRLNLANVSESEISGGKINGKLYGVNLGSNSMTYNYDPELYKKAGVEEPTPDWTWEDYIEKCKKIKNALNIYADDVNRTNTGNEQCLEFYLRQHGQRFYDESGKKLAFDDKLFVDYYTMLINLTKEGLNVPIEITSAIMHSAYGEYLISKQEAAAVWQNSNMIIALSAAAGRPIKMALLPNAKDQAQYGTIIRPSQFFSVAKNSKNPEWAVKFIDFFTNDIEANKILKGERGMPISSKVRENLRPLLSDVGKVMFDFHEIAVKHSSPYQPVFPKAHRQIMDLLELTYEKMFFNIGEYTPEMAAVEFREKANDILAE